MISVFSICFPFLAEIRHLCHSWFCCLFSSPTTLCLPNTPSSERFFFFLLFTWREKTFSSPDSFPLWQVHFPSCIFVIVCASVLPFSSCRYFWFLLPGQSNLLSTRPIILLLWPHKCRFFCLFLSAGGVNEGGGKWQVMERMENLSIFVHELSRRSSLETFVHWELLPKLPTHNHFSFPVLGSCYFCAASRTFCGWNHSRQPTIVFSWLQIASANQYPHIAYTKAET